MNLASNLSAFESAHRGWRGATATLAEDGVPVTVVDTVANRYEAGVVALAVTGEVKEAGDYLRDAIRVSDQNRRAELVKGDVLVVRTSDGGRRFAHPRQLTGVDLPMLGSRAAALGGRATVVPVAGQTCPRAPELAPGELEAATAVLTSGRWGLGPQNAAAAAAFSREFGIRHVVLAANGSVVLTLAVKALAIGEGDHVAMGATTFQATAGAMYDARVVPILIDCKAANDLTIDPDKLEAHLERCVAGGATLPKAVIAVALYHQMADLRALRRICDRYGLKLVLDFAHGPYAEIGGLPATRLADIVTYSFQQSKTLSLGEGGAIGTDDPRLAVIVQILVSCGYVPWTMLADQLVEGLALEELGTGGFRLPDEFGPRQSVNFRMPEVQAAQLRARVAIFRQVFDVAVENIAELQGVVAEFEDILEPYTIAPGHTGPFYKWGFRVKREWMPADVFRWAMRAQIGHEVVFCYPALTLADQRNPLVPEALRGMVNDEYFKAITARYEVPLAEQALTYTALFEWQFLVRGKPADELRRALWTIRRDRDDILAAA